MLADWMADFREGRLTDIIEGQSRRVVSFPAIPPLSQQRRLSFGLALHQLTEVVPMALLQSIPDSPSWVAGMLEWRKQSVPVIDLSHLFGLPITKQTDHARILILRSLPGTKRAAVLTVGAPHLIRLPIPQLPCERDLPVSLAFAFGAVEIYGETLVIPNLPLVLGELAEPSPIDSMEEPPLPQFGGDSEGPKFLS